MIATILEGDCREVLRSLPDRSVQTVVTSPPYFGLRDYGTGDWTGGNPACDHVGAPRQGQASTLAGNGHGPDRLSPYLQAQGVPFRDVCGRCGARRVDRQIGLEPTPDEFVEALVSVFHEVRRVLRDDGTVWLNLGDSYNADGRKGRAHMGEGKNSGYSAWVNKTAAGTKPKDLIGVPWLVAFALRADGWWLRMDVVWSKPNPMPESVTDRPTKAHEYLFLLSKRPVYYYDADAIREPHEMTPQRRTVSPVGQRGEDFAGQRGHRGMRDMVSDEPTTFGHPAGRNKRSVWHVATKPFSSERLGLGETEHFATFPPDLIEPCILAGSSPRACGECGAPWRRVTQTERDFTDRPGHPTRYGDTEAMSAKGFGMPSIAPPDVRTLGWEPSCSHSDDSGRCVVLDPFVGSGTVGVACGWHGRDFVGIELSPANAQLARDRIALEGRPGGRPASHKPAKLDHPSLFDFGGEAA